MTIDFMDRVLAVFIFILMTIWGMMIGYGLYSGVVMIWELL